jgi:hypothetical protein
MYPDYMRVAEAEEKRAARRQTETPSEAEEGAKALYAARRGAAAARS